MNAQRRAALLVIGLLCGLSLLGFSLARAAGTSVEATFLDVGQGDAALLRDGNGFTVLIDGGKVSQGATVLAFLRGRGIGRVDVVVVSHDDSDHIGGLSTVLAANDIQVGAVVYNGYIDVPTTTTWSTFATAVAGDGLIPTPAQFPQTFQWGDMTVQVLNPAAGLTAPDQNAASLVLKISHGTVDFLFTGDIDATQEAVIVARGTPVAAEILKVAHHGSRYSSGADFLAAAGPQAAVISVGGNPYGHPAVDTISRLQAAGAYVWRTDLDGNVVITSTGLSYIAPSLVVDLYLPLVQREYAVVSLPTPTATTAPSLPSSTPTTQANAPTATPTTSNGAATATTVPATASPVTPSATPVTPTATLVTPTPADLQITALNGTSTPESVVIQNFGGAAQDMTGWTLVSVVGPQTYTFPAGFTLGAGASVQIQSYTGAGDNPPTVLRWTTSPIWANTGDKAELRDTGNALISTSCYLNGCP